MIAALLITIILLLVFGAQGTVAFALIVVRGAIFIAAILLLIFAAYWIVT